MTFGMKVKTLQSFTNRPDKLEKTFEKITRDAEGLSTHAYDAVDEAVRLAILSGGLPITILISP